MSGRVPETTENKSAPDPPTGQRVEPGASPGKDLPTMAQPNRPTSLYRYYDQQGLLLYVGITSRGTSRNFEHAGQKEWWPFVARQLVEHFDTRAEAEERERLVIRKYRPPFNKQHNVDYEAMRAVYLAYAQSEPPEPFREMYRRLKKDLPLRVESIEGQRVYVATIPEHAEVARTLTGLTSQQATVPVLPVEGGKSVGNVRRLWTQSFIARMELHFKKPPAHLGDLRAHIAIEQDGDPPVCKLKLVYAADVEVAA